MSQETASWHRSWTIAGALRRLWEVAREEGVSGVWFRVIGEVFYRRGIVTLNPFGRTLARAARVFDITTEFVTDAAHPGLIALTPELSPAERQRRLEAGAVCGIGFHEGRPVGISWTSFGRVYIEYLDLWIELDEGMGYGFGTWVDPALRSRGLGRTLQLDTARHLLEEHGVEEAMALIQPENLASLALQRAQGRDVLGMLRCIRCGSRKWAWYRGSPERPRAPFRIVAGP